MVSGGDVMDTTEKALREEIEDLREEVDALDSDLENCQQERRSLEDYCNELEAKLADVDEAEPLVAAVLGLPSLDRDRFLADLCRECALLGIEWPASPKDETQRLSKHG